MKHDIINCICISTGKKYNSCWTDHSLPGNYNKCDQCCPYEYIPVSERLHKLNKKRKINNEN